LSSSELRSALLDKPAVAPATNGILRSGSIAVEYFGDCSFILVSFCEKILPRGASIEFEKDLGKLAILYALQNTHNR
jgi:hypothetical protein